MILNKLFLKTGNYIQTVFYLGNEVVEDKKSVLLGFKDSLPVLTTQLEYLKFGNMSTGKMRNNVKLLKVKVDPQTGEKFIQLNGKRLKMIPESNVSAHMKNSSPVSLISKPNITANISNTVAKVKTEANEYESKLSIKKVEKIVDTHSMPLQVISKQGNSKTNIKSNVCDQINNEINPKNINITIEKETKDQILQALDLRKIIKSVSNGRIDKASQTDVKSFNEVGVQSTNSDYIPTHLLKKEYTTSKEIGIQVEIDPLLSLFNIDDLDSILTNGLCDLPIEVAPVKNICDNNGYGSPAKDVVALNNTIAVNSKANAFFSELRSALQPDDEGNMPIHVSVLLGDLVSLKRNWLILKIRNVSLDIPNNNDYTALQLAIIHDANTCIISYLLMEGARLDIADADGNQLLHLAVEHERTDALQILLEYADKHGVDINVYNNDGLTPLIMCCLNRYQECAELLLDHGADTDIRDQVSGKTALFHAAEAQDLDMVALLLRYKANTKIKNFFGTSPHDAMYEIEEMSEQIRQLILGKGVKRKAIDNPIIPQLRKKPIRKNDVRLKTYAKFQKVNSIEITKVTS